jgi:hypothetical protein
MGNSARRRTIGSTAATKITAFLYRATLRAACSSRNNMARPRGIQLRAATMQSIAATSSMRNMFVFKNKDMDGI